MKRCLNLLLALLVLFASGAASPKGSPVSELTDSGTITGLVQFCPAGGPDQPLRGVLVYIPGESPVAFTDSAGFFTLRNVRSGVHALELHTSLPSVEPPAAVIDPVPVEAKSETDLGPICICGSGQVLCTDGCTDLFSDPENCGSCGNSCAVGDQCVGGTCMASGDDGCTPGYWKNHTDSWAVTGYSSGQSVDSVFAQAATYPTISAASLLQALDFGGGPGVEGAAMVLVRTGVAALLNGAHPGVNYPMLPTEVIAAVDASLASRDRDAMLASAAQLDAANNLGCPLSGAGK